MNYCKNLETPQSTLLKYIKLYFIVRMNVEKFREGGGEN